MKGESRCQDWLLCEKYVSLPGVLRWSEFWSRGQSQSVLAKLGILGKIYLFFWYTEVFLCGILLWSTMAIFFVINDASRYCAVNKKVQKNFFFSKPNFLYSRTNSCLCLFLYLCLFSYFYNCVCFSFISRNNLVQSTKNLKKTIITKVFMLIIFFNILESFIFHSLIQETKKLIFCYLFHGPSWCSQ